MSTVRASLAPVPDSGLADQTMEPDVVEPTPLADPVLLLVAPLPAEVPPLPLLPQPAKASAPATPTRAVTRQLLTERLPADLSDRSRIM
jgi:hypothetical protein